MYLKKIASLSAGVLLALPTVSAKIEGSLDPDCVVEEWSEVTSSAKIIDINFSDSFWPNSWQKGSGRDCPEWTDGGYVNAVLNVNAVSDDTGTATVDYPVLFHNCTFATKDSGTGQFKGRAGVTAAFARQYYHGDKASGNSVATMNNWTVAGHTRYIEDNIRYDEDGQPVYGEAGFVQMCRNASDDGGKTSLHGWMEIDHIPYVDRLQWSWSSTSWGRGIKCDIKIGDSDWEPLVWMGSEKQKQGWTVFSDQGYFMEHEIKAGDVSLRWRVWDGEDLSSPVQGDGAGGTVFTQAIDPFAQMQAPRVHKIKIYGAPVSAEEALYARNNPLNDVGELSDLTDFGGGEGQTEPAPDAEAPVVLLTVAADGSAQYTTVQGAIDAIPEGSRGIIYIKAGVYEENIYAGRKGENTRFISLIGEDRDRTVLTSKVGRGSGSATYLDCAAINVFAPRFYAENLTISNTAGNAAGQAEALYTEGDAHLLRNCAILGHQDTYKANVNARGYFLNCLLEGTVDFIYDGGLEWFEDCEIRSVRSANGGGYVTAPASSGLSLNKAIYPELSATNFYAGLFFNRCRLTAGEGVGRGSVTLGRPWDERSGSMFLRSVIGEHISAAGWTAWGGSENTSSLYEYRNVNPDGTAVSTASRASFSAQATDAEVEAYINPRFLFSAASKVPFDYNAIARAPAKPSNFTVGSSIITWESDDTAAGYLVYRDGELFDFTAAAVIENPDAGALYSVKSVSRYGATSEAADAVETTRLLAFPTAEGFGKYTTGGRGGEVVTVTSLADDGSVGTLRWALQQHPGRPLTVVFAVSGEIALASELRVSRSDFTIAGQTAPGNGIVVTHAKVNFGGSQNFIVRNMRFRIGQKSLAGEIIADNACGAENCSNFIFDHCTFGWSIEENMNTADSHFLTVQYCMVHEGLYEGGHSKGARGYGCQWGGSPATYHHNLLAHNKSRSCRFNGARGEDHVVFMEYVNNVNYNYGSTGGCYGGENTAPIQSYNGMNSAHECNFMNNYYKMGPASDASIVVFVLSSYAREGATSWGPAKWYVDGNVAHGRNRYTQNNWSAMSAEQYKVTDVKADERIVPANNWYQYTIAGPVGSYLPERYMLNDFESGEDAFETVVAKAGTVNRDKVEVRVAEDVRLGKATYGGSIGKSSGIIDTENDAEGFFAYPADYEVPLDTDGDGMPDAWERANGLDPATPDNNRMNADGYTALEVYLCSLMGETLSHDFSSAVMVEAASTEMRYDRATDLLTVGEGAVGGRMYVYGPDGSLRAAAPVASTVMTLGSLPEGISLIVLEAPGLAPRTLRIVR